MIRHSAFFMLFAICAGPLAMVSAAQADQAGGQENQQQQTGGQENQAARAIEELFATTYATELRIYGLQHASASEMVQLIQSSLTAISVFDVRKGSNEESLLVGGFTILESIGDFLIASKPLPSRTNLAGRLGVGIGQARVVERAEVQQRTNMILVMATRQTHDQIESMISALDVAAAPIQGQPEGRPYKVEVTILEGAGGARVSLDEGLHLSFSTSGVVSEILARAGDEVQAGQSIARLDTREYELDLLDHQITLETMGKRVARYARAMESMRAQVGAVAASANAVGNARQRLMEAEADFKRAEIDIQRIQNALDAHDLKSPVQGTVVHVQTYLHATARSGEIVMTIAPTETDGAPQDRTGGTRRSELAARYGINEADFEMFGFETIDEVGRGLVNLIAERGDAGRARMNISAGYICSLEFQDARAPYLLVRAELQRVTRNSRDEPTSTETVLENTLFLEVDKPSVLGLTNMRGEALILIVRLREAGAR